MLLSVHLNMQIVKFKGRIIDTRYILHGGLAHFHCTQNILHICLPPDAPTIQNDLVNSCKSCFFGQRWEMTVSRYPPFHIHI